MNPKLSIVTPCYNCSGTLEEAINSTLNQGFSSEEFEIILVDDASTDNSIEVMNALAAKHENITVLKQPKNKGGGAARNRGIREARASVIFVLDSDDILFPSTLKRMYDYLNLKGADVVAFNYSTKFRGKNSQDVLFRLELPYRGERIPLESLALAKKTHSPLVINSMYKKNAWEKVGGYPEHHHWDTQGFGWRLLAAGLIAYTCPDTDYLHRVEYHESYYLREWNSGKSNLNWREILMENELLFTDEVKHFLNTFPYQNFTKDIIKELQNFNPVFRTDYAALLGTIKPRTERIGNEAPVPRNSIQGIVFRVQYRLNLIMNTLIDKVRWLSNGVSRRGKTLFIWPAINHDDKQAFEELRVQLADEYKKVSPSYDYKKYLMDAWEQFRIHIESAFLTQKHFEFLKDPTIKGTMFFLHSKKGQLMQETLIAESLGEMRAKQILRENTTGSPLLDSFRFRTSGNAIHQLYHLVKFSKETGISLEKLGTILEFGGGYGCLAKTVKRLLPGATHIIIDIPIFSFIQELYLKSVLGNDAVVRHDTPKAIISGKINLIPLNDQTICEFASLIPAPDLFVSTWALSEANTATHVLVKELNYFNAKNLLLAYQRDSETFPFAEQIANLSDSYESIHHEPIAHQEHSTYLFAKKVK